MNPQDPVKSTVKRQTLQGKKVADALAVLTTTCNAGAQCTEVQGDAVAAAALTDLVGKVTTANTCVMAKQKIDQDRKAAAKKVNSAWTHVKTSLTTYETSVDGVAAGDAAVITKAGLESRHEAPTTTPTLQQVVKVTSTLGKVAQQSVLHWPKTPDRAPWSDAILATAR